jgi:hypothetical protein
MAIGLSAGGVPLNVTVPVIVEAAKATLGHASPAISQAPNRTLFPVQRMFGSLVIANTRYEITTDAAAVRPRVRRLYTGLAVSATHAQR